MTGLGAVAALIFNPLAGYFSDRWVTSDNRSLIVSVGLVTGAISLGLLGLQHSVIGIAICWTLCQATINIAYSSMAASVIDHVPRKDWGFAWGLIAVSQALGIILGFGAIVLIFKSVTGGMTAIAGCYAVCLVPLVVLLIRLPRVHPAGAARPVREGLKALLNGGTGYSAVWIGQFLVDAGELDRPALPLLLPPGRHPLPEAGHRPAHPGLVATGATIVATVTVGRLSPTGRPATAGTPCSPLRCWPPPASCSPWSAPGTR